MPDRETNFREFGFYELLSLPGRLNPLISSPEHS